VSIGPVQSVEGQRYQGSATHHLPPGLLAPLALRRLRAFHLLYALGEQLPFEA
jgi:hypothetical protein